MRGDFLQASIHVEHADGLLGATAPFPDRDFLKIESLEPLILHSPPKSSVNFADQRRASGVGSKIVRISFDEHAIAVELAIFIHFH